jgi:Tol biopolymer transport system component
VVYIAGTLNDEWFVVFDGEEGKRYDEVFMWDYRGHPRFSMDSKHFAYLAREGELWTVVLDGEEGRFYEDSMLPFEFSPDGTKLVHEGQRDGGMFIVLNDEELYTYERIIDPMFSPNGQRLAFEAKKNGKWGFVIDGDELGFNHDFTHRGFFSPDSQRFAYTAERGDKEILVVDGEEQGVYDNFWIFPEFSQDSKQISFAAVDNEKCNVIVDGEVLGSYAYCPISILFSPDSNHVIYDAYIGDDADERVVVVNGEEIGPYDAIISPGVIIDSDSNFHFMAIKGNKIFLIEVEIY